MMNVTVSTTGRTVVEFATGTLTIWHFNADVREGVLASLHLWVAKQGEGAQVLANFAKRVDACPLKASASWQCCASGKIEGCVCVKAFA